MGSLSRAASSSRTVAAAAGAVGFVVADTHGDARHALMLVLGALAGAELRLGLEVVNFFNAVLDEERLGESRQLQLAHAAVELGEHGIENGIFFGVGAGGLRAKMWHEEEECDRTAAKKCVSEANEICAVPPVRSFSSKNARKDAAPGTVTRRAKCRSFDALRRPRRTPVAVDDI